MKFKHIALLLIATCILQYSQAQTAKKSTNICTNISYWQTQILQNFEAINLKPISDFKYTTHAQLAGLDSIQISKATNNAKGFVDGFAFFKNYSKALAIYSQIRQELYTCFKQKKYTIEAEAIEAKFKSQTFLEKSKTKAGGYFEVHIAIDQHYNSNDQPHGYEVSLSVIRR
jgi:hypothetical protein